MRMRCHFSIIFESLWQFWAVIALMLFQQIDTIVELVQDIGETGIRSALASGGLWGLLILAALTLVVLGFQYIRWRKTWVILDGNLIIVERNTLRKVRNTIAIENLSAVNMERNLFERIVGTYRIKMDTGSLTTANKTDISIVFAEDKATAFRKAVLERMAELKGNKPEEALSAERRPDEIIEERRREGQEVFSYSTGDMMAHCFFSMSLFNLFIVIAGVGGFSWYINRFGLSGFVIEALGGIMVLAFMVLSAAWDLIRRFITYYHFTVYRDGEDLHLHYGLIKIRSYTIPVDQITCLEIEQPVLSRIFGRYQARVVTVGVGDEKGESANLTMALPKKKFVHQLSALLPEYPMCGVAWEGTIKMDGHEGMAKADGTSESAGMPEPAGMTENDETTWILDHLHRQHPKAAVIKLVKLVKWAAVLGVGIFVLNRFTPIPDSWSWTVWAGYGILLLLIALLYILSHRTAGYAMDQEMAALVSGMFYRRIHLCRYGKMQNLAFSVHPISRRYGIMCGVVHLLNKAVAIPYMTEEDADQLADKMISHCCWGK